MTELTGLVLAGGARSRMGRDKAAVKVDGQRLVDRAVRRLAALAGVCRGVGRRRFPRVASR